MNRHFETNEYAIERIETFYDTAAVLEHCDIVASGVAHNTSDEPYDYDNLYVAPD